MSMAEGVRSSLPEETQALLYSYFDAFCNLYGITPLYRAYRIIRKQNPELGLTEEEFLAFTKQVEEEEHFYIIAGEEDIYEDVAEPTPPMKREIIAEYLYAVDDFDSYEELKEKQGDKQFYIPDKEELLKYADAFYDEDIPEARALEAFLRDRAKANRAEDVMGDLRMMARMEETNIEYLVNSVRRLGGKRCLSTERQIEEFMNYYIAMYNNTRLDTNRGFTPMEMEAWPDP